MDINDELQQLRNKFRLLDNWDIRYVTDSKYKGQVSINTETKRADIYSWVNEEETPEDFLLHELLHIACRESKSADGDWHEKEEVLIQDICSIFLEIKGLYDN